MFPVRYLTSQAYIDAARELDVEVAVIKAVDKVESAGHGFLKGTDLPKILFEGHWFHEYTDGRFDRDYPSLSYSKWTKTHYKGGRGEYDRLIRAISINDGDARPALLSTSWGRFQIMGFNHDKAGYATVEAFVNDMAQDEGLHLKAFVAFIKATGLADELRSKSWADFARQYNGSGYRKNKYDTRMAAEFAVHRKQVELSRKSGSLLPERQDVIALQTALNIRIGGELPSMLVVDGWMGENTRRAIRIFREESDLPEGHAIDADLCNALGIEISHYHEEEIV